MKLIKKAVLALVLIGVISAGVLISAGLTDELEPADVAVVLGNEVMDDGLPHPRLVARLDRGLALWQDGLVSDVLVSGGESRSGFNEAVAMRDYLLAQGMAPDALYMDAVGWNTRATAQNAADMAGVYGWESYTAVTQYFHMPRTWLAMRQAGLSPVHTAHAEFFEPRDLYSIPREVVGYATYLAGLK
jgi:vancomycin permeability regulator SanA